MTVELNVVGVFYTGAINIGAGGSKTVKNVMDDAQHQSTNPIFRYTALGVGNQSVVNSIAALHRTPFKSRSNKSYPAGIYRLGQTFTNPTPNPYTVWQYYLFDQAGKRVPVPAETSYAVTQVQDGWKIVWRLVTICNGPTQLSHRMEKLLPPDLVTPEIF